MRGAAERLNLKIVKEFFFCYKERNFQMMRSNLHYELTDDDLMEHIRDYIQSRRDSFHGVVFEDIAEVFQALNKSEENTKPSEFPDFVCENGFIEHFEITSSNETRKGSTKKIDQFLFNKDIIPKIEEFNRSCDNMEVGETRSESWSKKDVSHSYENLTKSFKNNLTKHIGSADNYSGKKDLKIYLVEYGDFGIEMCEDIGSNPEYYARNKRKPDHCWNYRLSRDKNMLRYIYDYKDDIDYIIMNYHDYCEIVKVSSIPLIIKCLPYDYVIIGRESFIRRSQINTRVGINISD